MTGLIERAHLDVFSHETAVSERVSRLRLLLGVTSLVVVVFDRDASYSTRPDFSYWVTLSAVALLVYAATAFSLLRLRRINSEHCTILLPFLDVSLASLLICLTEGALSPFVLWLVFGVVTAGFARSRLLSLSVAVFSLVVLGLMSRMLPQSALGAVFAMRTALLLGASLCISLIVSHLAAQSRSLALIDRWGQWLANASTAEETGQLVVACAMDTLGAQAASLTLGNDVCIRAGKLPGNGRATAVPWILKSSGQELGVLRIIRATALTRHERALVGALCDRAASALQRIRLVSSAEQLKLFDRLHDACFPLLAAMDLRVEAARRMADGQDGELVEEELTTIKQLARQASSTIRQALGDREDCFAAGPAALRALVARRWQGAADVHIEPDVTLSAERWRVVEQVVKEGLNNASRHGKATRVSIWIYRLINGDVACSIQSDGERVNGPITFGYGLSRLREAVEEHGGRFRVAPAEPGGVAMVAQFGASG